jgi:hypothetical protein
MRRAARWVLFLAAIAGAGIAIGLWPRAGDPVCTMCPPGRCRG